MNVWMNEWMNECVLAILICLRLRRVWVFMNIKLSLLLLFVVFIWNVYCRFFVCFQLILFGYMIVIFSRLTKVILVLWTCAKCLSVTN